MPAKLVDADRDYLYAFLMFYYYVEIVSKLNQNISMKKRGLRRNLLSDIIFRCGIWLMLNVQIPVRIHRKRNDL